MTTTSALAAMDPESRRRFCREVLESLSDLVEGEAPEDLCRRVDELLGDCQPFQAFRNTFAATVELTRRLGHGEALPRGFDEDIYRRCIERARRAVGE
ncbi:MAG TPA: hypothetical protein VGG06_31365 [Thermoanaerobaculia bacterium]|jgi:hypothetical protein